MKYRPTLRNLQNILKFSGQLLKPDHFFGEVMLTAATTPLLTSESPALNHYQIIRRTGAVVPFEPSLIAQALLDAFTKLQGIVETAWTDFVGCVYLWLFAWQRTYRNAITDTPSIQKSRVFATPCSRMGFFSASKLNMRNAP